MAETIESVTVNNLDRHIAFLRNWRAAINSGEKFNIRWNIGPTSGTRRLDDFPTFKVGIDYHIVANGPSEVWINLYPPARRVCHSSREEADAAASAHRVACYKFVRADEAETERARS